MTSVHRSISPERSPRARLLPWILVALGGVILVVLALMTLVHVRKTDQQKARLLKGPIPIEAGPARVAAIEKVVGGSGQIEPYATVTVTSKLSTQIVNLPVNLGSFVKAGTLLAELDGRLQQATVFANQELFETNQVKARNYETQWKRLVSLRAQKMAADFDLETAEINLMTAKQAVATTGLALEEAKMDLEHTRLTAPVNGVVIERPANPGEFAKLNGEVLKLGEVDDVYMNAKIAEEEINSVRVSMSAELSFDAFPGEVFTGIVEKIDPKTNPVTHAFPVYIKIANPGWRLLPGLTGFARLKQSRRTLTVPNTAVINPVGDHASVFVIDSQRRAHQRSVRLGVMASALTEVLSGLQEGELVALTGQLYLADNDEVLINPTNARR